MTIQYESTVGEGVGRVFFVLDSNPATKQTVAAGWTYASLNAAIIAFFGAPVIVQPAPNNALFGCIGFNTNSTAGQVLTQLVSFSQYRITEVWVSGASVSLAALTKTFSLDTVSTGGGSAFVTGQNLQALVTPANMLTCPLTATDVQTATPLYGHMSSAGTGVAATCNVYACGEVLG